MARRFCHVRFVAIVLALLFASFLLGCTVAPTAEPAQVAAQPTQAPGQEPSPTTEFKVELPVSATPTQVTKDGTPLPSPTPGPTNTRRPTKTPWPTQAPTAAPVDDPSMVYVPGGEFLFGSDAFKEDETPLQTIEIEAFNIDIQPVTNADYEEFVDATGHRAPRHWKEGLVPAGIEDHPVVWVSWEDANAYATWAGKRLPTELEWERAARGADGKVYPWGDAFDATNCNSRESESKGTTPVGQYPGGASPSGALGMAGNVWEWTADWYQPYRGSLYQMDRYGETYRVLRGGSWFDGADAVRTTVRNSAKQTFTFSTIGFRCAQ